MKLFALRRITNYPFAAIASLSLLSSCSSKTSVPKADLADALKKTMPEGVELTDVSYEIAPATNGQSNATLLVKTKITATANQDLYSQPTDAAEIKAVNDYINFYNAYVMWTNALQQTPYANDLNRDKPTVDANIPKFLHRDQVKGDTFTGYSDVNAEHQVDRWIFAANRGIDWGAKKPSIVSAKFGQNCVGANAPDGQAAVQTFNANEKAMNQFRKQFADKHAAESRAIVEALKPLLTGEKEFQTVAKSPGMEVPNYRFSFSAYDPQTNHFRIRIRNVMGDFMGTGEIDGDFILIFQDGVQYMPARIAFVGSYDSKTGDLTLLHKGSDPEVLHTHK